MAEAPPEQPGAAVDDVVEALVTFESSLELPDDDIPADDFKSILVHGFAGPLASRTSSTSCAVKVAGPATLL